MGEMQVVEHLQDASVYSLPPVPLNLKVFYVHVGVISFF